MTVARGDRYVLISPVRSEEDFIERTLETVAAQSVPPALWVVVDDGSTDRTPEILRSWTERLPYLRVVTRPQGQPRAVGPGVIRAFYAGLATVDLSEFDYLCKLDVDLELPPSYFEGLMRRMQAEPRIGTCSGKAYYRGDRGELISEGISDEMSVGAAKFYRRACFEQIGGFVREVMWDGIDCHRCRMLGWIACSWDDPELRFVHLRPMGSSQVSIWTGRQRHGFGQWFMGTGLAYMTASAIYRMTRPPLVVGGLGMWWGYVRSLIARDPRLEDPVFRKFLRRYQWAMLLRGKRAATASLHERGAELWDPDRAGPWPLEVSSE